jgi:hypothetical protein
MSGVQMFLVIGGITLFALLSMNVNRSIAFSEDQKLNSEFIAAATSVGQSLINEITSKDFDHSTQNNGPYSYYLLTTPNALGPEAGEVLATYNDVDDYNNHTREVTVPRSGTFSTSVEVKYVDDMDKKLIINQKSRTKRIKVTVTSPFLSDTINLYYFKSY